ncbi:hypothetical protein K501DRAFT_279692 [Backusella circina FSU 941]|nr:hypothetical protein K501DRAFT_279692 [Backusella circina FSU 941]
MGIVKLFSKHHEKNTRRIPLKYDQRRHSSMSFFKVSPSNGNVLLDDTTENRLTSDNAAMIKNRDSALVRGTSGIFTNETMDLSSSSSISTDIQSVPKAPRKSESKQSNHRSPQYSKRRSTSKALSLSDIKCTCDMPHTSTPNRNRASAPILNIYHSNKYEYSFKEKLDQDPLKSNQSENLKDSTLCSELLSTQQSLKLILAEITPQIQKPVEQVINQIGCALKMATSLESRLKTVIDISKQTILDKVEQIKKLENQRQIEKSFNELTLEDNKMLKTQIKEMDVTIKEIEYLLLESQIEPTKEEGGTILQQIESILAISTASSILNDKLRLELDTSDARVKELRNKCTTLHNLVEDNQKSKREKELCRLQKNVYNLEENVTYLSKQLESSKETIRLMNEESSQKNKQLLDSDTAFRKKMGTEFCSNVIKTDAVQNESKYFEKMMDEAEDSLTAWQEIAENRLQLGGYKYQSDRPHHFKELYQSNTEQQRDQHQHIDMKQNVSGLLESSESYNNKNRLEKQMDYHKPTITASESILDKTNDSVHYYQHNLVDQSNDPIQYFIESNKQSLEQYKVVDQADSKNAKNTIENSNGLQKTLCWDIANEKTRWLGVNSKNKESKCESELDIDKNDFTADFKLPQNGDKQICQTQFNNGVGYSTEQEKFTKNISVNQISVTLKPVNEGTSIISNASLRNSDRFEPELSDSEYSIVSTGTNNAKKKLSTEQTPKNQTGGGPERNVNPLKFDNKIFKKSITSTINRYRDEERLPENESIRSTDLQHENDTFLKVLDYSQNKVKIDTSSKSYDIYAQNVLEEKKGQQQEELMRIHTRAQLGLIEYLEGENNMSLAISRFRKQLENEMNALHFETT